MATRTNISLPGDLKKRMDRVKERVNWSQVAAQAFEVKLAEISAKKEKQNLEDVIQRLKASKIEGANEDYKTGCDEGQLWAKVHANWKELERLAAIDPQWWGAYFECGMADGFLSQVNPAVYGDEDDPEASRDARKEFWKLWAKEPRPDDDFVRGFADGAEAVYREVRGKV